MTPPKKTKLLSGHLSQQAPEGLGSAESTFTSRNPPGKSEGKVGGYSGKAMHLYDSGLTKSCLYLSIWQEYSLPNPAPNSLHLILHHPKGYPTSSFLLGIFSFWH